MPLLMGKAVHRHLQYGGQDTRRRRSDRKARHIGAFFGTRRVGYADRLDLIGKIAEGFFSENKIPFIPGTAGYFCWIDLNEYMIGDDFEAEEELYNYIYEHGKVIICPVRFQ